MRGKGRKFIQQVINSFVYWIHEGWRLCFKEQTGWLGVVTPTNSSPNIFDWWGRKTVNSSAILLQFQNQ